MATEAEVAAKVEKTVTNMDRLDVFVNGGPTTDAIVDGGAPVPSLQKIAARAEVQIDAAEQYAQDAAASAAVAQTFVNGLLFNSVADGLAATSNGQFFAVAGTYPSNVYATLYRNNGGSAEKREELYSKSGLDAIVLGQTVTLSANAALASFNPRAGDKYVLNGFTLTIEHMNDSPYENIFSGSGSVVIRSGFARPEWWTTQRMRKAAAAVSAGGGGAVLLRAGSPYPPEFTIDAPMTSPNASFKGSGRPLFGAGFASLTGGTVCQGPFVVNAENVAVEDLGVDAGSSVCNALYGGAAQEGLIFPNIGQVVGAPPRYGLKVRNVSALCKDANAPTHGILVENAINALVEDVETVYGQNGVVLKTRGSTVRKAFCRGHATNAGIDKSDVYAPSRGNTWDDFTFASITGNDTGPLRLQAASASSSGHSFRRIRGTGVSGVLSIETYGSNTAADINGDDITGDALRFHGVSIGAGGGSISRIRLNSLGFNNIADNIDGTYGGGLRVTTGVDDVKVTNFHAENTAGDGVWNAGTNVVVSEAAVVNPASGRVGYRGVGASMMRLSLARGTVASDTPGTVQGSIRQPWTPVFGGGFVPSPTVVATYLVSDGICYWDITFTGGTSASPEGSNFSGFPIGGRPGTSQAAFISGTPSIPATGQTNGVGGGFLPTWASTADGVVVSGQFLV